MSRRLISRSREDTVRIGEAFAREASPGEVYALTGDLGAGKTAFASGFGRGLGVKEAVASPTFTILSEYRSGRCPMYHFDFYRLNSAEELDEIAFFEELTDGIVLVEWADRFSGVLPDNAVTVRITADHSEGDDYRIIEVEP